MVERCRSSTDSSDFRCRNDRHGPACIGWSSGEGDPHPRCAAASGWQMSDDDPFNGSLFVQNWVEELTRLVPVP